MRWQLLRGQRQYQQPKWCSQQRLDSATRLAYSLDHLQARWTFRQQAATTSISRCSKPSEKRFTFSHTIWPKGEHVLKSVHASPIETDAARSMLDQLLDDSRLYRKGADYKNLLDFVVRLRNFAPFNALLLQIQKPGLNHAASARDWRENFSRTIKEDARPLLILWPFGPVALVYDVMDTAGDPLPMGVSAFEAVGVIDQTALDRFASLTGKKNIVWNRVDMGDLKAGSIGVLSRPAKLGEASTYRMTVNMNHNPNVQFATLAHELAHLFLGHLGQDKYLGVPLRPTQTNEQEELEAESTAYIICARNGVENQSASYLKNYVKQDTTTEQLDLYQIMRAAGQVETLLGLAAHTKVDKPQKKRSETMPLFPIDGHDLFDTSQS